MHLFYVYLQMIKWTLHILQALLGYMGVDFGGWFS